jgi:adenine phosphoribosyltransferase
MDLKAAIREIPDFPKPGILFYDLSTVFLDPRAFRAAVDGLADLVATLACDKLVAIESRGFLLGAPLGLRLEKGLVLARKAGKLPAATEGITYDLEYGTATIEIHRDAIGAGDRVVVLDDLLATGGTAAAVGDLVRKLGGQVAAYVFMVELGFLAGRGRLAGAPVFSLVNYA